MQEILSAVRRGVLTEAEAETRIMAILYERGEDFLLDLHREKRIGFPEVVYAAGKSVPQVLAIAAAILEEKGAVFVSGLDDERESALRGRFPDRILRQAGRVLVIRADAAAPAPLGTVGLVTAGTSDIPYARECGLILSELGAEVVEAFDAGAAGMHRPELGLRTVRNADVLIVFAGMEGVLPPLIASLTPQPVIAVPTPIGYGHGGLGEGALCTMLQTCVPGVLVVNIGNAVGAAAGAVRILKAIRKGGGE
ncbi:MAG TPA: nickel pincer cofactor biosynthesis protein LarB [Syntrophus sp. (in: bacteria)]|nr:nickel pincer cofactor biosynthesis protein LarB [Syntrophus sp. (in: bacteria)]